MARSPCPAEADLGANFEAIRAIDPGASYPGSFLSGRFASIDAFTTQGRAAILDAYGYRPAPVPPAAAGARRAPTNVKGYVSGSRTRPSGTIGSGTPARPVSTSGGSGSQQDAYSSYYGSGSPQKPSATAQPALIGPLGYDDLK